MEKEVGRRNKMIDVTHDDEKLREERQKHKEQTDNAQDEAISGMNSYFNSLE